MKLSLHELVSLVLSLTAILYGLAPENIFLYSLGLALLLLFLRELKAFARVRKASESLSIERSADRGVVRELKDVEVSITVVNKGSEPILRALIVDGLPRFIKPRAKPVALTSIPPRTLLAIRYSASVEAPGTHTLEGVRVAVTDFLGFFSDELSLSAKAFVTAPPLVTRVGAEFRAMQRVIGISVAGKALGWLYDLVDIRECQPGGSVKKIV